MGTIFDLSVGPKVQELFTFFTALNLFGFTDTLRVRETLHLCLLCGEGRRVIAKVKEGENESNSPFLEMWRQLTFDPPIKAEELAKYACDMSAAEQLSPHSIWLRTAPKENDKVFLTHFQCAYAQMESEGLANLTLEQLEALLPVPYVQTEAEKHNTWFNLRFAIEYVSFALNQSVKNLAGQYMGKAVIAGKSRSKTLKQHLPKLDLQVKRFNARENACVALAESSNSLTIKALAHGKSNRELLTPLVNALYDTDGIFSSKPSEHHTTEFRSFLSWQTSYATASLQELSLLVTCFQPSKEKAQQLSQIDDLALLLEAIDRFKSCMRVHVHMLELVGRLEQSAFSKTAGTSPLAAAETHEHKGEHKGEHKAEKGATPVPAQAEESLDDIYAWICQSDRGSASPSHSAPAAVAKPKGKKKAKKEKSVSKTRLATTSLIKTRCVKTGIACFKPLFSSARRCNLRHEIERNVRTS